MRTQKWIDDFKLELERFGNEIWKNESLHIKYTNIRVKVNYLLDKEQQEVQK